MKVTCQAFTTKSIGNKLLLTLQFCSITPLFTAHPEEPRPNKPSHGSPKQPLTQLAQDKMAPGSPGPRRQSVINCSHAETKMSASDTGFTGAPDNYQISTQNMIFTNTLSPHTATAVAGHALTPTKWRLGGGISSGRCPAPSPSHP